MLPPLPMESDAWPVRIACILSDLASTETINGFVEWIGTIDTPGPSRLSTDFKRGTITTAFAPDVDDSTVQWWVGLFRAQPRLLAVVTTIDDPL